MDNQGPRTHIDSLIEERDLDTLLDLAAGFHGHYCPGLAMGIIAGVDAMNRLGQLPDGLEDLIAITETNNCFSDGIQVVTGCTFGNNGLVFKDLGKTAFTLAGRNSNAVRYCALPEGRELMRREYAEYSDAYDQVVKEKKRDPQSLAAYFRLGRLRARTVLKIEVNRLFSITETSADLPDYAPSLPSHRCASCGEEVMEGRLVQTGIGEQCLFCAGKHIPSLSGQGIKLSGS